VVLYEMLLRRKPFPADTVTSLVYQILHEDPCADPRTTTALGAGVAELLRDALAKDPAARIPDAATFARRARSLAGAAFAPTAALPAAHAVAAAPPAPAPPARIPLPPTEATRTPSAAAGKGWIVAAILGGLAVLGVLGLLLRRPAPPPVESPEPARAATSVPGAGNPIAIQPATPRVEKRERAAPEPAPPVAPAAAPATAPAAPAAGNDRAAAPAATPAATESAPPAATTRAGAEPVVWSDMPVGEVFTVSRGAEFHVDPDKAIVAVAGKVLGKADDWDGSGGGKTYYFPGPGVYVARFALPGYRTVYVKFVVRPDATTPIANVDTELEEVK